MYIYKNLSADDNSAAFESFVKLKEQIYERIKSTPGAHDSLITMNNILGNNGARLYLYQSYITRLRFYISNNYSNRISIVKDIDDTCLLLLIDGRDLTDNVINDIIGKALVNNYNMFDNPAFVDDFNIMGKFVRNIYRHFRIQPGNKSYGGSARDMIYREDGISICIYGNVFKQIRQDTCDVNIIKSLLLSNNIIQYYNLLYNHLNRKYNNQFNLLIPDSLIVNKIPAYQPKHNLYTIY